MLTNYYLPILSKVGVRATQPAAPAEAVKVISLPLVVDVALLKVTVQLAPTTHSLRFHLFAACQPTGESLKSLD